ncbi:MAG TPA: Rpn family recombination-promoting nuclease/putative transposase [Myxococcaceae bacterium]|nr:Rpn family recombination-promoting nuclease/putative transposase [Myxococcaceae bacterium]
MFARYTFEHPQRAEAELRAVLPPAVVAEVDWSTLRRESSSVVDRELRETESDLLFSARLRGGRAVLLYVLLEHQSSVDAWMAWRMLRYVVRQLEHWRQRHPESQRLPVIIPLVLYHGEEGGWTAPRRVEELFDVPEPHESWCALLPRFEYLLDDLTAEQAEALMSRAGPPVVRLALLALRYGRSEELAEQLPRWTALFTELWAEPGGQQELFTLIRYLLRVGDETTHAATAGVLNSVMDARRAEALMRSFGDELIERGRQQGLAQGLEKGEARGLARGRAEGVLRILVVRGVPVDEAARQRIISCTDLATLDLWFDRALGATRLADVLDDVAH